MANSYLKASLKIVDEITDEIKKSHKTLAKEGLAEFAEEFYKFVPSEDMAGYDAKKYASVVADSFKFFQSHTRGTSKIRVFNPSVKANGWENSHTVIELINDDMPFLVDSVVEELYRNGLEIHLLAHPVFDAKRNKKGELEEVKAVSASSTRESTESVIHLQVTEIVDSKAIARLEADLKRVMDAVKVAVDDWLSILQRANYVITELSASAEFLSHKVTQKEKEQMTENASEIKEFLEWLKNGNFVFLGYIEYGFDKADKNNLRKPSIVRGSELGVLKLADPEILPVHIKDETSNPLLGKSPTLLDITKANRKSIVHRPVHMDYIGIKRLNEKGEVIGEHRFLGLFTSGVYYQSAKNIPIIRKKISTIQKKSGFSSNGHSGKALTAILEDFPRDELLQSTENELFDAAMGITLLVTKPKVRFFVRKDEFERFLSCIIFIPREVMSTELRVKMEAILAKAFDGTIANHYTQITESHMARLQIIVKTTPGKIPSYDEKEIEELLSKAARRWTDDLKDELQKRFDDKKSEQLFAAYENAFSVSYQTRFSTEDAYYDIIQIEKLLEGAEAMFDIYESLEGTEDIFEFKVYTPDQQMPLSKIMPIMDNMGLLTLDEHTYTVQPANSKTNVWIHRFRFSVVGVKKPKLNTIKANFEESIAKTWSGEIQNDSLNKLILLANVNWRDVVMVRAYTKFLQQSAFAYSQSYIRDALCKHPELVKILITLFYVRFDPSFEGDREKKSKELLNQIDNILSKVSNLAEDRVIRGLTELMLATMRTNFFQPDSNKNLKDYISFKFSPALISWLPKPKPFAEIFVYSPRIEGVHLRGGKVARGGLRWSDRMEDFRTEVLGLMKAQMTKNSVIIPLGSKGGFVVKRPPLEGGREAYLKEGVECYKTFLRGLLDVTDNIVAGKIKNPKNVVRHDENDAYLVVAADKGTATFSDYANSVSAEYNFWLGDAFASGGSAGYDHKKMGITAKGAWISVKRHFSEMGVDVDKDNFTVIGVGDMSGDVFGNGLLRSKCAKLVGAFNHMHIFLDPNPDAAASFKERKRLFNLPRSSWTDYDKSLISKGGGIFERSAKSIKLSKEVQDLLDISISETTPDELIRYMLKAPIDLLWNGGIGTYVKSQIESNDQVGDKTNDVLRVNGADLRVKVVGEGGNLGFTQLGRIEYAKNGGRINTDAIDNSAGVDCSDHEVNIKIALGAATAAGSLTLEDRNKLLESMTDEVGELVLRDNILQTQALTKAQLQGVSNLEVLGRFMTTLEKAGRLNREIEFLPDEKEINSRHAEGKGLTRPELSVILAYSKIVLFEELTNSTLPDDAYFNDALISYFPAAMQKKYKKEIEQHPLRREIIATSVTNSIINRIGSASFYQLLEDTGTDSSDIARSYTVARDVFDLRNIWDEIAEVKGVELQNRQELFSEVQKIIERASLWFPRNYPQPLNITEAVTKFAPGVKALESCLGKVLPKPALEVYEQRLKHYKSFGTPEKLAEKIAGLDALSSACDIVDVAAQTKLTVNITAKIYFELGSRLNLGWLRRALDKIPASSYWQRISCKTLIDELYDEQRRLTSEAIKHLCGDNKCSTALNAWEAENYKQLERFDNVINSLKAQEEPDLSMIIIAIRKIREISVLK